MPSADGVWEIKQSMESGAGGGACTLLDVATYVRYQDYLGVAPTSADMGEQSCVRSSTLQSWHLMRQTGQPRCSKAQNTALGWEKNCVWQSIMLVRARILAISGAFGIDRRSEMMRREPLRSSLQKLHQITAKPLAIPTVIVITYVASIDQIKAGRAANLVTTCASDRRLRSE
jgi:hypothetical protein